MTRISFIMMAKNVGRYIDAALDALQKADHADWELIFVDDGSTDATLALASARAATDPRIRMFRNPFVGKVKGTSYAYTQVTGDIIKCIDADDVLHPDFFAFAQRHAQHDVLFHSADIVDEDLRVITTYHLSTAWLRADFRQVAENLISVPKWAWSFTREVGDKVFPLPDELPFEDVWMALLCKKHAKNPGFTRAPLYAYRQHAEQTFGGILNFSKQATVFRAERLLKLMDVLDRQDRVQPEGARLDFAMTRRECETLARRRSILSYLLGGQVRLRAMARIVLEGRAPGVVAWLAKRRWAQEGRRA